MDELLMDILERLRVSESIAERDFTILVNKHNKLLPAGELHHSKKRLLHYVQRVRDKDPQRYASWGLEPELERRLMATLQLKPRRSASGVATITVITRPQPCAGNCIYCPSDLRMPKSYLHNEPACCRAERCFFDPYLQVASRIKALRQMGHAVDKIELIVLGGSFCDYPSDYRLWFMKGLFDACNDSEAEALIHSQELRSYYAKLQLEGLPGDEASLSAALAPLQNQVDAGELSYGQAFARYYPKHPQWQQLAAQQRADWPELLAAHVRNERGAHRVVGLVVETRPDSIGPVSLAELRRMGCTKLQLGVQTLDPLINAANGRALTPDCAQRAFELLRLFGFKIHAHFMMNLAGATPAADLADYARFMGEPGFRPDEVKLYPCALIRGSALQRSYEAGAWRPYSEEELVNTLVQDIRITPPWCRVSRMIRDFSAEDIMVGNKMGNLRQLVEERLRAQDADPSLKLPPVQEIRFREIATSELDPQSLRLDVIPYETSASREYFLQWLAPGNRIVGFLRLSLPQADAASALIRQLEDAGIATGLSPQNAMIRELHIYGRAAALSSSNASSPQHRGLGRQLIARACEIAQGEGFAAIQVISSVGTREYYRSLGFADKDLYQELRF